MRNLKKLLAVVVAICVLATFTVPAFAEDSAIYANADQAQKLYDMGLYAGISTTSFVPDLGSKLTREQGMVLLLKLFGKLDAANAMTDEEVTAALAAYTDADKLSSWAKKAMAYVVKNGISAGTSATTVGAKDTFTGNQFATLILKQAGYTVADWTKAAEELAAKGVTGATALATTQLTRDDLVGIAFGALTVVNADGKTLIAALVEAGKVTAAAAEAAGIYTAKVSVSSIAGAGAKKLLVKFSAPVADTAKMVLSVKRDGIVVNLVAASTTWNAAKTEATLTSSYLLQDGKYVVTAKYDTQDATTATADIKAAAVSKISFVSNNAIITDTDGNAATTADAKQSIRTTLKFENQYGEDVTNDTTIDKISVTSSKGDGTAATITKGVLKITDTADYVVGNTVVVTVVYKSPSVIATSTLTIAQAADVASVALADVKTDYSDYKDKPIYLANDMTKYYIPVTVKDQYGNVLKAADLTGTIILSSNESIVNPAAAITADADGNTILALEAQTGTKASGTAVVTVVSPSGKSGSLTIQILDNGKIDTLTLSQPEDIVKEGVQITIPFTAVNQYGTALVKDTDLAINAGSTTATKLVFTDGTTVSITNGIIGAYVDYVKDNARVIKITPNNPTDTVVLTVITANAKVQTLTLSVQDAPKPVAVSSVSTDFKTAIQFTQTQLLKESYINLVDQYGKDIDLPAGWTLNIAANDGTFSNVTLPAAATNVNLAPAASVLVTAAASKGTETVKVTLKDNSTPVKTIDEFTFGIESVDPDDLTGYTIADFEHTMYTGTNAAIQATHGSTFTVYGLKGTTEVVVPQTVMMGAAINVSGITVTTGGAITTGAIDTDGADKTAKITVVAQGTKETYTITKNLVYNDSAPAAKVLEFRDADGNAIADPVVTKAVAAGDDILNSNPKEPIYVYVEDQYGVALDDATFIVTNELDETGAAADVISISAAGVVSAGVDGLVSGSSFKLTVITSNGMSKTIKVYIA